MIEIWITHKRDGPWQRNLWREVNWKLNEKSKKCFEGCIWSGWKNTWYHALIFHAERKIEREITNNVLGSCWVPTTRLRPKKMFLGELASTQFRMPYDVWNLIHEEFSCLINSLNHKNKRTRTFWEHNPSSTYQPPRIAISKRTKLTQNNSINKLVEWILNGF